MVMLEPLRDEDRGFMTTLTQALASTEHPCQGQHMCYAYARNLFGRGTAILHQVPPGVSHPR